MTLSGPVSDAAHGGRTNPWFLLAVGTIVLAVTWIHYLRTDRANRPPVRNSLGVSVICLVFILAGFFELTR
ncbi:MAG TPA: hypothetical protein VNU23_06190 [Candidatus Cybelea sp.]|nr:hypothetical protein [Candidatus Cybelea sp.]